MPFLDRIFSAGRIGGTFDLAKPVDSNCLKAAVDRAPKKHKKLCLGACGSGNRLYICTRFEKQERVIDCSLLRYVFRAMFF